MKLLATIFGFVLAVERVLGQDPGGGIIPGSTGNTPGSVGNTPGSSGNIPSIWDPLRGKEIWTIIENVTEFLAIRIAPPLVGVLIVWGALQMMLSGGNTEKYAAGKKTITYAVIGFVIVLVATGVANLIKQILGTGQ